MKCLGVLMKSNFRQTSFERLQFYAFCKRVPLFPSRKDRQMIWSSAFLEKLTCSKSWCVWTLPCFTTQFSDLNSSFLLGSWEMNSPEATKHKRQNDKSSGQVYNQRSGVGLSRAKPRFFNMSAIWKDNFDPINIIFLISRLTFTFIFAKMFLAKKIKFKTFSFVDTDKLFHKTKFTTSTPELSEHRTIFVFLCGQRSVLLCRNGWLQQTRFLHLL